MSQRGLVSSSVDDMESMRGFYHDWIDRQEGFLDELQRSIASPNSNGEDEDAEARLSELVERVMAHYNDYYHAKSRVAQDNVFLLFSPTWLTPLERSFLWITGFKPGLAFQIVDRFVTDLSEEQRGTIEEVRGLTKAEEKEMEDELARIQETVAAPPLAELARRAARAVDGELVDLETGLGLIRTAMETLVECADSLRIGTLERILSVLKSSQSVNFFNALTQFQLQIRHWGIQREASTATASAAAP